MRKESKKRIKSVGYSTYYDVGREKKSKVKNDDNETSTMLTLVKLTTIQAYKSPNSKVTWKFRGQRSKKFQELKEE